MRGLIETIAREHLERDEPVQPSVHPGLFVSSRSAFAEKFEKHSSAFVLQLAEAIGTSVVGRAKVLLLVADDWYDDAPRAVLRSAKTGTLRPVRGPKVLRVEVDG